MLVLVLVLVLVHVWLEVVEVWGGAMASHSASTASMAVGTVVLSHTGG